MEYDIYGSEYEEKYKGKYYTRFSGHNIDINHALNNICYETLNDGNKKFLKIHLLKTEDFREYMHIKTIDSERTISNKDKIKIDCQDYNIENIVFNIDKNKWEIYINKKIIINIDLGYEKTILKAVSVYNQMIDEKNENERMKDKVEPGKMSLLNKVFDLFSNRNT